MRSTDYEFVSSDSSTLLTNLISKYEIMTGRTLEPASPDRLFLSWVADVLIHERVNQNYIGNQNIPSRAEGENLDSLGEWIYSLPRNPAQPAKCMVRFLISEAQDTSISVPVGTRVTDTSQTLVWTTTSDALIPIGETSVDIMVQCETNGVIGNGYAPGQINALIDVDNILYFDSCFNTGISDGGAEEENDDDYYNRMRLVLDSYSTAGAEGSYIYWAKSVSDLIADVKAINPKRIREEESEIYTDRNGIAYVFFGGDQIDINSLKVYSHDSAAESVPGTDYEVSYDKGLLKIKILPGEALGGAASVDVYFNQAQGGHVHIYALMKDGTIANSTIKSAISSACNQEYVRPITDVVSVEDPKTVQYDINITYFVPNNSKLPLEDIQIAVTNAVNEYKEWQSEKLGRDINPAKLWQLLMQTGIKRTVITSPQFQVLSSGKDGSVPEIAVIGDIVVINGGYEDE